MITFVNICKVPLKSLACLPIDDCKNQHLICIVTCIECYTPIGGFPFLRQDEHLSPAWHSGTSPVSNPQLSDY